MAVHKEVGFDQFNCEPGTAEEMQFLSVALETDHIG